MDDEQNKSVFENDGNFSSVDMQQGGNVPEDQVTESAEVMMEDNGAETDNTYNTDSNNEEYLSGVFSQQAGEETGILSQWQASQQQMEPESQTENTEANDSKKKKKKYNGVLYSSTIITMVLVIASIAAYAIYAGFFQTSLHGAWISTDVEEITNDYAYLVLDDNNQAYMTFGSVRYLGTYETSEDDEGNKLLTVDIPSVLQTDFIYEFVNKNTISLQMENDTDSYTYKKVDLPDATLDTLEGYTVDQNLLGSWLDTRYGIEYDFSEDGRMYINEGGLLEADCVYTVEDGVIHVEYYSGDTRTMDMEYSVNGDELTIGVMSFIKIAEADGTQIDITSTEEQTQSTASAESTTENAVAEETTEAATA